ncbi:ribonuclease Y [Caldicellulosiruptoraceae bacterium PP1]
MQTISGANIIITSVVSLIVAIIAFFIGYLYRKKIAEKVIKSAEQEAFRIIDEAKKQAEASKKEATLSAKEEIHRARNDFEREVRERRSELQRLERRLIQKEEMLDKKTSQVEEKDEQLNQKLKDIQKLQEEIEEIKKKENEELQRISGLTQEEAKQIIIKSVEQEVKHDLAVMIKEYEQQAKEEADKKAREIISLSIQRYSSDYVAENTVSVVSLPNDEMKGRIIGREGRNIKAFETVTGIDLIIDDTPEAVILSGFDPIRREIAKLTLEKLILDGRIHPARIEEMYDKAKKEVETKIREEGERIVFELGIHNLHPELIKTIGKLRYRTSYGQNVLSHSIEVAVIAGIMAAELGIDQSIAKRAGLLHDIGKAVDHEVEGSHALIGYELAKRYKETNIDVLESIAGHHGEMETKSIYNVLIQAADSISAARPGARRESLESYIKRLQKLEEIANSFEGVEKAYAIQAGREIRIMVKPEIVNDESIVLIAREIVKRIENEVDYPGQIKVNVIREVRTIEYAK